MEPEEPAKALQASPFGPVHVLEPTAPHTHTAILLHGRGSTGEEFAEELHESKLSNGKSLSQNLPGWRLVFPSSRELWSEVFEEDMPAWFEAHSLTDTTARQDLQPAGIRESVKHLEGIVSDEVEALGGVSERVVSGGISQGGATGMWTLLCLSDSIGRLGAFIGLSTWLPFAANIETVFGQHTPHQGEDQNVMAVDNDGDKFVRAMTGASSSCSARPHYQETFLLTPVLLGHGIDDAYVDVKLGQQARHVLSQLGLVVEWKEYSGAEQEGHWLKAPEELDDIVAFLKKNVANA
jgi:lysophospholipase-2